MQRIATVVMVACLVLAAINFGTVLADPVGRLFLPASGPEQITIITIYPPGALFPGNSWIMDYLKDGESKTVYAPTEEHMDRIIEMWEERGIEISWVEAAK